MQRKSDITAGRIIERVLSAKIGKDVPEITIVHGVDKYHNITRLIDNLFEYFPDSEITFKKLQYGYELKIKVIF